MKNRKFALVAFLLIAVLVMGIGYAAITRQLTVTGKVAFGTNVANFPVKIENCQVTAASNKAPTDLASAVNFTVGTDGITLTANVQSGVLVFTDSEEQDSVTFTFDVTNYAEHYKANIHDVVDTHDDYLDVTVTGIDDSTMLDVAGGENDSVTVTVVVKLVSLPNEDGTISFNINFKATSVEPTAP